MLVVKDWAKRWRHFAEGGGELEIVEESNGTEHIPCGHSPPYGLA